MDRPAWLTALITILAALGAAGIQTPLLWRVGTYVRTWTREVLAGRSRSEQLVDAGRSTSGLSPEGTEPKAEEHET
ncbi:MAG: hypothetical protein ACLQIB_16880 [Isosphaeraceae bacterium]